MEPRAVTNAKYDFNVCFDQRAVVSSVPIRAGGETRKPPFARNPRNRGADVRYALVIFLPWRLLCSGHSGSYIWKASKDW